MSWADEVAAYRAEREGTLKARGESHAVWLEMLDTFVQENDDLIRQRVDELGEVVYGDKNENRGILRRPVRPAVSFEPESTGVYWGLHDGDINKQSYKHLDRGQLFYKSTSDSDIVIALDFKHESGSIAGLEVIAIQDY